MFINLYIEDIKQKIVIELTQCHPNKNNKYSGGIIIEGTLRDNWKSGDDVADAVYNRMMDAIESTLLAHACAGIDVTDEKYTTGLATAINACAHQF